MPLKHFLVKTGELSPSSGFANYILSFSSSQDVSVVVFHNQTIKCYYEGKTHTDFVEIDDY